MWPSESMYRIPVTVVMVASFSALPVALCRDRDRASESAEHTVGVVRSTCATSSRGQRPRLSSRLLDEIAANLPAIVSRTELLASISAMGAHSWLGNFQRCESDSRPRGVMSRRSYVGAARRQLLPHVGRSETSDSSPTRFFKSNPLAVGALLSKCVEQRPSPSGERSDCTGPVGET